MDLQRPHVSVHRENKEIARPPKPFANRKFVQGNLKKVSFGFLFGFQKGPTQFLSIVLLLRQQNLSSLILILTLSQPYILMEILFLLSPALIFLLLVVLLLFIFLFTVVFPTGTGDVNQWVGLRQGHFVFSWTWEHFSSSRRAVSLIWHIAETLVGFLIFF